MENNMTPNVKLIVSELNARTTELQILFDAAWEIKKTVTPTNSLSRLCTTLLPSMATCFLNEESPT